MDILCNNSYYHQQEGGDNNYCKLRTHPAATDIAGMDIVDGSFFITGNGIGKRILKGYLGKTVSKTKKPLSFIPKTKKMLSVFGFETTKFESVNYIKTEENFVEFCRTYQIPEMAIWYFDRDLSLFNDIAKYCNIVDIEAEKVLLIKLQMKLTTLRESKGLSRKPDFVSILNQPLCLGLIFDYLLSLGLGQKEKEKILFCLRKERVEKTFPFLFEQAKDIEELVKLMGKNNLTFSDIQLHFCEEIAEYICEQDGDGDFFGKECIRFFTKKYFSEFTVKPF